MSAGIPVAAFEREEGKAWMEMQRAVPDDFRAQLGIAVERIDTAVVLVASRSSNIAINRTLLHGLDAPLTRERLAEVIARYAHHGVGRFLLQWCPFAAPRDAHQLLTAAGFEARTRMARMYRRAEPVPLPATGLELGVASPSDREAFGLLLARANEGPLTFAPGLASTLGLPGWQHYVALRGGEPVGGAAVRIRGDTAWCGLAGTLPEARRTGAHHLLLAVRINAAARAGCRWVICETMEDTGERPNPAFRNMRRAGFETAYLRTNYLHDSGSRAT